MGAFRKVWVIMTRRADEKDWAEFEEDVLKQIR